MVTVLALNFGPQTRNVMSLHLTDAVYFSLQEYLDFLKKKPGRAETAQSLEKVHCTFSLCTFQPRSRWG